MEINCDSDQWKELHRKSYKNPIFTASNIAAVIGVGNFKSRKEALDEYINEVVDERTNDFDARRYGTLIEPFIFKSFRKTYGDVYDMMIPNPPMRQCPGFDFIWASPDVLALEAGTSRYALIEFKSGRLPEKVPSDYFIQVQMQMHCFRNLNKDGVMRAMLYYENHSNGTQKKLFGIEYCEDVVSTVIDILWLTRNQLLNDPKGIDWKVAPGLRRRVERAIDEYTVLIV